MPRLGLAGAAVALVISACSGASSPPASATPTAAAVSSASPVATTAPSPSASAPATPTPAATAAALPTTAPPPTAAATTPRPTAPPATPPPASAPPTVPATTPPTPAPTAAPSASPSPTPSPATAVVVVQGFAFDPKTLEVAVGTTVTWTNVDGTDHTTTSGSPGSPSGLWNARLAGSGGTFSFTFTQPGTYAYFCAIHTSMTGTVVVK